MNIIVVISTHLRQQNVQLMSTDVQLTQQIADKLKQQIADGDGCEATYLTRGKEARSIIKGTEGILNQNYYSAELTLTAFNFHMSTFHVFLLACEHSMSKSGFLTQTTPHTNIRHVIAFDKQNSCN